MFGIIGAMEIETEGLIEKLTDRNDVPIGAYKFVCGKPAKKKIYFGRAY